MCCFLANTVDDLISMTNTTLLHSSFNHCASLPLSPDPQWGAQAWRDGGPGPSLTRRQETPPCRSPPESQKTMLLGEHRLHRVTATIHYRLTPMSNGVNRQGRSKGTKVPWLQCPVSDTHGKQVNGSIQRGKKIKDNGQTKFFIVSLIGA